jgi:LacI family transcriptional regulator
VGVITRKSSDLLAVKHKGVANGLRFIWEHFHEPIRVKDLLNVAGMSRRGLHKAFMENIGRTPGQELQRLRMEKAKRLLADSDQKIEVLASMCGYQSANSFSVAFKNTTGMTLSHFRKSVVHSAAKDQ